MASPLPARGTRREGKHTWRPVPRCDDAPSTRRRTPSCSVGTSATATSVVGGAGCYNLHIYNDEKYRPSTRASPTLMRRSNQAAAHTRAWSPGCVITTVSWRHWPCLFPQHGPGRKHERPIVLEDWQRTIVEEHPGPFLRGLFHSDGCRVMNWRPGDGLRAR